MIEEILMQESPIFMEDPPMPKTIEIIQIVRKVKKRIKTKCDACPCSSNTVYYLQVGDTKLIKMCPKCLNRLKNAVLD